MKVKLNCWALLNTGHQWLIPKDFYGLFSLLNIVYVVQHGLYGVMTLFILVLYIMIMTRFILVEFT